MAVFPSADSATEYPCQLPPAPPVPTSFAPGWFHTAPLRVYTHVAPTLPLSPYPPTTAVLPFPDSATEIPWSELKNAPAPTSFAPCWLHTPPLRVYAHAAPTLPLSTGPPTTAVVPSAGTATEHPWCAPPTAPVPTS